MEVLVEREGGARRPHIKGVGSQRELPTINWRGWVLNGSFGREGGREWRGGHISKGLGVRGNCRQLIGTGGYSMEVLVEREGRARRPHMKGVGSQSKLPT